MVDDTGNRKSCQEGEDPLRDDLVDEDDLWEETRVSCGTTKGRRRERRKRTPKTIEKNSLSFDAETSVKVESLEHRRRTQGGRPEADGGFDLEKGEECMLCVRTDRHDGIPKAGELQEKQGLPRRLARIQRTRIR